MTDHQGHDARAHQTTARQVRKARDDVSVRPPYFDGGYFHVLETHVGVKHGACRAGHWRSMIGRSSRGPFRSDRACTPHSH